MRELVDRGVTVRAVLALCAELRRHGIDVVTWVRDAGADPSVLFDPRDFVPRIATYELWRRAEALLGPDVVLSLLDQVDVRALGSLHHASDYYMLQLVVASRSVDQALTLIARHLFTDNGSARARRVDDETHARVIFDYPEIERAPRTYLECSTATFAYALAVVGSKPLDTLRIEFMHAPRGSAHALRVPAVHHAPHYAISVARRELDLRLSSGVGLDVDALVAQAEARLLAHAATETLVDRVRARIAVALDRGDDPRSAEIALHLGYSERHLARLLAVEGSSHRVLVDAERRRRAFALLDAGRTLTETAHAVGFSDERALRRALKRWRSQ